MSFLRHNYLGILLHLEYYSILLKHIWTVISPQFLPISSSDTPDIYSSTAFVPNVQIKPPLKETMHSNMNINAWTYSDLWDVLLPWYDMVVSRLTQTSLFSSFADVVVAHTGLDGLLCWAPPFMSRRVSCVISASRRRQHQAWKDRIIYPNRFFRTVLHTEPIQTLIHDTTSGHLIVLINVLYFKVIWMYLDHLLSWYSTHSKS